MVGDAHSSQEEEGMKRGGEKRKQTHRETNILSRTTERTGKDKITKNTLAEREGEMERERRG